MTAQGTEKRKGRSGCAENANLCAAAGCCVVALGFLGVVAAKQVGLVRHLPDPPGALWESDRITGSKAAHPLGVPDGLLGLGSYGVTLALLLSAQRCEAARRVLPWKLAADAGAAGFNAVRQVVTFGKMCSWCMGTALATVGLVGFGWPRSAEPNGLPVSGRVRFAACLRSGIGR